MKSCPFCAEDIQDKAIVCKHCGRDLVPSNVCAKCGEDITLGVATCPACGAAQIVASPPRPPTPTVIVQTVAAPPSRGIAAVLSLFIPGAGQMYRGHVVRGLLWLMFVVAGYVMFIVPGVILHLCCILAAASGNDPASAVVTTSAPVVWSSPRVPPLTPRRSNAIERGIGRALASVVHPRTAWRAGGGSRAAVVIVYAFVGGYMALVILYAAGVPLFRH